MSECGAALKAIVDAFNYVGEIQAKDDAERQKLADAQIALSNAALAVRSVVAAREGWPT